MKGRFVCVMDMMGGKPGVHFSLEQVAPTVTKGRASVNDIHLICYIIDPLASNSMKSRNPHSGFHQSEYVPTLDTSTQNPIRNGGGLTVVSIKK